MTILDQVLIEEANRLEKKIAFYEQKLSSLPRGTIFIRKIGSSSYAYRRKKENGKVASTYLGNINNDSTKLQIELSKEYKRIKENLRNCKTQLLQYRRVLKTFKLQ